MGFVDVFRTKSVRTSSHFFGTTDHGEHAVGRKSVSSGNYAACEETALMCLLLHASVVGAVLKEKIQWSYIPLWHPGTDLKI